MEKQQHYHALAFLCPVLMEHIDALQNTNRYKHALKNRGNLFLKELEIAYKDFFDEVEKQDKKFVKRHEQDLPPLEAFYAVSRGYETLAQVFSELPPWRMPYLIEKVKAFLKEDYTGQIIQIDEVKR